LKEIINRIPSNLAPFGVGGELTPLANGNFHKPNGWRSMDAKREIQRLQSLAGWTGVRNSGMLYLLLQGNLLWDFHLQKSGSPWPNVIL